jgi:hypothetical protein
MSKKVGTEKQIIITLMGLATALVTGCALGYFEASTHIPLYSFMFFFIIPVGAIMAGILAASGYYFGAMTFNQKPAGGVAINMILIAIGSYFLANYIPYELLEVQGARVKEMVSFWEYMDTIIRHTSLSIKGHSTGEIGSTFGYIFALIQIIGFSFGGFIVFGALESLPFCNDCSEYLKKTNTRDRFTSEGEILSENVESFVKMLDEKQYRTAIALHDSKMGVAEIAGHHLKSTITMYKCKTCGINHLDFGIARLGQDGWKDVDNTSIKRWINPKEDASHKESATQEVSASS